MSYLDGALLSRKINEITYVVVYDEDYTTDDVEEKNELHNESLAAFGVIEYKTCSSCGQLEPTGNSLWGMVRENPEETLDEYLELQKQ